MKIFSDKFVRKMYIDIAQEKLCCILKRRYFLIENANANSNSLERKNIVTETRTKFLHLVVHRLLTTIDNLC